MITTYSFLRPLQGADIRVIHDELMHAVVHKDFVVKFKAKTEDNGHDISVVINTAGLPGKRGGQPANPSSTLWWKDKKDIGFNATDTLLSDLADAIKQKICDLGETPDAAVHYACKELSQLPAIQTNLADA